MSESKLANEYTALFLLVFIIVFAFGLCVGLLLCSSGDTGAVTVNVVNESGDNIEDASVELDGSTKQTNANGLTTFGGVNTGTYSTTASAAGYNSNTTSVEVQTGNNSATIVLSPSSGNNGGGNGGSGSSKLDE